MPTQAQKDKARADRRRAMENRNRKIEERRRNRGGGVKIKEPHRVNTDRPQPTSDLRK